MAVDLVLSSRDKMIVALLLKHEMHMCWPPRMSMQFLQQSPNRPIMRNGIRHRHNGLEPEHALCVALHDASSVRPIMVCMLHVVVACRVSFPDVDLAAFDGLSGCVLESAEYETRLAGGIGGDGRAIGQVLSFVGVEWSEDGAFGAVGWFGVVDRVDKKRETKYVGEQDKFLRWFSGRWSGQQRRGSRHTCRTSVHVLPVAVRNSRPAIHSFVLNRVSRAKSWRCDTSLSKIYLNRGSGLPELMRIVFSVMVSALKFLIGGILTRDGSILT
jgi:hypothetical protein